MNETLLTVEQAATRLQVKPYTVRHWLRLGRVRGVKIGRDWRISDRELSARVSGTPARIPAPYNPMHAPTTREERAQRLAALDTLGQGVPDLRTDAGLSPLDLSGERADVYGYSEREDNQR